MIGGRGPCWPTPTQDILLQVALRERAVAEPAWQELRPRLDLDVMEIGSFALLPLLYRRLVEWGTEDPDLERLKGIYRRVWYGTNVLLEDAATACEVLAAQGVSALLTEGASVAPRYYEDPGLRRLEYADILVRPGTEAAAVTALAASGFKRWVEGTTAVRVPLTGPRGSVCVIGSAPPLELALSGALSRSTDDFWRDAVVTPVAGRSASVLSSTDELLFALVAGCRATVPAARVQWAVDATMIIRGAGADLDWDRLFESAQQRRAVPRLQRALRYVAATCAAPVPEDALERLSALPVTRRDRLALYLNERPYGVAGGLPYSLAAHLRFTADETPLGALRALPAFLQRTWDLDRPSQIPLHLLRKGAGSPFRALSRRMSARQRAATSARQVSASSTGS
jgi:putative nucleotidyltransferase-like protein